MAESAEMGFEAPQCPSDLRSGSSRRSLERKLESLEALRAIAALLVVFYHLQDIFGARFGIVPLFGLFGAGDRGVDLFFVLSGFIIARTHAQDLNRPERLSLYIYKRICRIYPSVWVLSACAAGFYLLHFGGQPKAGKLGCWDVIASTLLLPQGKPPLVNVTWTLTYEIFFYALFSLLIVSRRFGLLLLLGWQAGVALMAARLLRHPDAVAAYYLRPICLEFGIGMLCALLVAKPHITRTLGWAGGAVISATGAAAVLSGLLYEALWHPHILESVRYLVFGLGAGALIIGLTFLEQGGKIRVPSVLVRLGGASYAIYLVHFSIITLAAVGLQWSHLLPINNVVMLACATLGIAAGVMFHVCVDQPIQVVLRRVGRKLFQRTQASPGSAMGRPLPTNGMARPQW